MHYAWRIAKEGYNPVNVENFPNLNVCWMHYDEGDVPDAAAAKTAAEAMVVAFHIAFRPAYPNSLHFTGDAVDTTILWRSDFTIMDANGTAVLNSADPQVVELAALCDGKVIFYGTSSELPAIAKHRQDGERVVYLRNDEIVLGIGMEDVATLPLASLKPAKASQPEMVMAAVAAAWALDIPPELIGAGLRTFESSPKKTPY